MEKWNRAAQSFPLRGITRIFRHIDRCVSTFLFSKRARTTFQSTLAFLYRREVEKSLDSSRVRVLLAAKEFTHTEISRCHCPPPLNYKQSLLHSILLPFIAFSTRDSLFFPSFAAYHSPHFSFSMSNEFSSHLLIRTYISFTIYLFEDKLCRLMSFLLIISDIFREDEYKTEVYKREREKERVPVLKIAQRRKVG